MADSATSLSNRADSPESEYDETSESKRNAFGVGSPHWNLPFPIGNLTAAEILAYLPHWLKSVDVVDRFISNGGRSHTICAMINEFRHLPDDNVFRSNSAQVMMSYVMRRAGFDGWKVGIHDQFDRPDPDMKETDMNVEDFRCPRETHPKGGSGNMPREMLKVNLEAPPIDFKDLALYVKKHPTGFDTLDLARCVRYALTNEHELWLFPNDFQDLVIKLGGPTPITKKHLDRQVFNRREGYKFPKGPKNHPDDDTDAMPATPKRKARTTVPASPSPLKRMMSADDTEQTGSRRTSGRLANKPTKSFREYGEYASDTADDVPTLLSPFTTPPPKKRKTCRAPSTPISSANDSDFLQEESEGDDEIPEAEEVSDGEFITPPPRIARRAAANKAREVIRNLSTETERNIEALKQKSAEAQTALMPPPPVPRRNIEVSAEMMALAAGFSKRQPIRVDPPVLSANRLVVDEWSLPLYSAYGCTTIQEMWDTALSSTRFGGPRTSAPFRELHRLTMPPVNDHSDWAENIRWAKEQHRLFGSETWTEYDYHLQLITDHRRLSLWVSEEVITGGM